MTCGIYKISNTINGKIYIGQSVNIEHRIRAHKYSTTRDDKNHPILYKAFNKYGLDNFTFDTIIICEESLLDFFEIKTIELYQSFGKLGYNMTKGGSAGCTGYKHTEESKQKIIESNKNRIITSETKQKISISNTGRKLSDETKNAMSKVRKGKTIGKEHRKQIGAGVRKKHFVVEGVIYNTFIEFGEKNNMCRNKAAKYIKSLGLDIIYD